MLATYVYTKAYPIKETAIRTPQAIEPQVPAYAANEDHTVSSPDGTHKFIMKQSPKKNLTTYTFFVQDESGNQNLLLTKIAPSKETFLLPANTWSPDNVYVFINEHFNENTQVYVLNTTKPEQEAINITTIFEKKNTPYTFQEATGWASPELLIVETTQGKQRGPTFWYDTTSAGFIQLSRHQ